MQKKKQDERENLTYSQYTTIGDKIPWTTFYAVLKNELKNLPHLEIQYPYTLSRIQCCTSTDNRLIFQGESGSKQKLFRNLHGTVWAIVSQIVGEFFVQT